MIEPNNFLEEIYDKSATKLSASDSIISTLPSPIKSFLDIILERSESSKGVLTVLITSITYKSINPSQDIRLHQTGILNGYSGRTFDTKHITPFMKGKKFPAMAESGWLTRSLEQKVPYNLSYQGAIKPKELKEAFLGILDVIENTPTSEIKSKSEDILDYLFQGLIVARNKHSIDLARPMNLSISKIIKLLLDHFNNSYTADGASRLPVLALYAIYECLIKEVKRFETKELLPLENHTTADSRSGSIGDIEIIDEKGKSFEAVEVKHGIPISLQLVKDAYSKFSVTQAQRYYLLSTVDILETERLSIESEIEKIKNVHGCQVIANGLPRSLNYYLRLLDSTSIFIDNYVTLLEKDKTIKFEHKAKWNELIGAI